MSDVRLVKDDGRTAGGDVSVDTYKVQISLPGDELVEVTTDRDTGTVRLGFYHDQDIFGKPGDLFVELDPANARILGLALTGGSFVVTGTSEAEWRYNRYGD